MSMTKFLKTEIGKTGYPLEIEISSLLDRSPDWTVINTDSYYDTDEKKLRDIDIRADTYLELDSLSVRARLVAECKRNHDFAWVFFTRPIEIDEDEFTGHYLDEMQMADLDISTRTRIAKETMEQFPIAKQILKDWVKSVSKLF